MKNSIQKYKQERIKLYEYLLVYLTIAIVNPTFQQYEFLSIGVFVLAIVFFVIKGKDLDNFSVYLYTLLLILLLAQAFEFGNFTMRSFIGILMLWSIPYFILKVVKRNFIICYVDVLYILSIVGLLFWFLSNISPTIHNGLFTLARLLKTDPESGESLIIYNLEHHRPTDIFFMKNAGPFAEGGVFSCFLILALILNTIIVKRLKEKKNIIFIISIITTTSTAGYIALFIFVIVYYLIGKSFRTKLIIAPLAIVLAYYGYNKIPFLSDKVESQYESQMQMSTETNVRVGRFQSARVSLLILKDNFLFGKGLFREDRFISKQEEELGITGTSNGIIDFALKYGIVSWFIYFYLFYKALKKLCILMNFEQGFALFAMLPIFLVGSAQAPFTLPVFVAIAFHGYYLKNKIIYPISREQPKKPILMIT